jgi:hypothetical protein
MLTKEASVRCAVMSVPTVKGFEFLLCRRNYEISITRCIFKYQTNHPMKTKTLLLFSPLLILFICSCNKESLSEKIVGKWQIQERYDGYAMGGTYQWSSIPAQYQYYLEFSANGNFAENHWNFGQCDGTYSLVNENKLRINSSCYTTPVNLNITLSDNTLIITYNVIEGQIKEKFLKIK